MRVESRNPFCSLCKQPFKEGVDLGLNLTRLCDECQSLVRTILPKRNLKPAVATLGQAKYITASLEPSSGPRSDYTDGAPSSIVDRPPFAKKDSEESVDVSTLGLPYTNADAPADEELSKRQLQEAFKQPAGESASPLPTFEDNNAAVDPWNNPLPTWDYSRNEWPILVKAQPRGRLHGLKIPLTVSALIALIVVGYFLVYRPLTDSEGQSQGMSANADSNKPDSNKSEGLTPPANAEAAKDGERQPDSTPPDGSALTNKDAAQPQTNGADTQNELGKSQGLYSLQAASFPDEPSARQYSEKLLRAGVSAYVVSADIAGRGKWYRVRVGRFNTPDEAERYRAQSRLRAKAAGMNIDLILCEYGKQ